MTMHKALHPRNDVDRLYVSRKEEGRGLASIKHQSVLLASQNNAIRTNHIKPRIYKTQQNGKCKICSYRDETINHIISECRKLSEKEYKARFEWVGKVIHLEIRKKFKFDHIDKWYMHNPENDTHKLLWDFNNETDQLIPARRPDLTIINNKKENLSNCRLCSPGGPQNKSEGMCNMDKNLDLARELKKQWNIIVTIVPIVIGAFEDLEVGGRVETIQMTALLRTARIGRRVLET